MAGLASMLGLGGGMPDPQQMAKLATKMPGGLPPGLPGAGGLPPNMPGLPPGLPGLPGAMPKFPSGLPGLPGTGKKK
jgi:signal recognition particle subunit SRP54